MASQLDFMSIRIFARLSNGMGGLDWSGLELAAAQLGVDDIDGLIERIEVIKMYKKPDAA